MIKVSIMSLADMYGVCVCVVGGHSGMRKATKSVKKTCT